MSRLFWKIFLSFCSAMVLIVISFAWVQFVIQERFGDSQRIHEMLRQSTEAIAFTLKDQGPQQTSRALRRPRGGPGRRFSQSLVIGPDGRELLGRSPPPHVVPLLDPKRGEQRLRNPPTLAVTVTGADGRTYRVVSFSPFPPQMLLAVGREGQLLRTGLAVLICALVSVLLARYLTRPLQRLRWVTREMAEGNLAARVTDTGRYGRDELGQLAADFDRMAARLEHSLGLHRQLLVDVSHELRSPLARLQVATELARQRAGDRARPELDRIENEANRLNELIGELLLLSRQSDSEQPLQRESTNLEDLLTTIVEDARLEGARREVSVTLNCEGDLTAPINETLIGRAVENAIRNALRYSPDGGEVAVRAGRDQADRIAITVADEGPGIAEDQLEHIFRPFYRVGAARDRASGGHGLGLAIARSAVERHDGEISARNRESGGLIVEMALPT